MVGLTNGALTGAALVGLLPSRFWIRPRLNERSVITIIALMLFAYAAATLFLRPCGAFDSAFRVSRCVMALQLPDAPLRVAFSPDGEVLVVEAADGALSLWRADNTSAAAEWTQDAGELLAEPRFTSAGTALQTISSGAVQTWRVRDGTLQRTQKLAGAASANITAAAFSADGALTALGVCAQTACANAEARLWRTADGASAGALKGAAGAIEHLTFSPDGSLLAAAVCSATETEPCVQVDVLVWRLRDSRLLYVVRGHAGKPTDLAFSADGAQLASTAADGSVVVWRASNGEQLLQLQYTTAVNHLLFSADGTLLWGGAIPPAQWRLPTGDAVRLSDMPGAPAALSPDGKILALFTADARVVLWGNGE
jgi:WD40 repeat protein